MNALFLTFNSDYAEYAKGAIVSFRKHHPGWRVLVHAVNAKYLLTRDIFWQQPFITVDEYEHKFDDKGQEREYCNSRRFCAYLRHLDQYEKVIATDCDILFKEYLAEIIDALDKYEVCMYYDEAKEPRIRAGASFLGLRGGSAASAFLSVYKRNLMTKGRNWYNDQICLGEAYEELKGNASFFLFPYEAYCYSGLDVDGIAKCHVIQPRGDKNNPVLQYYRNLLEAELRGATERIMIVGSGISGEKVKKWDLKGWHTIVINNAWQLRNDWDELIHPNDFTNLPKMVKPNQRIISNAIYMPANTAFGNQAERGNSMVFQALYYALLKRPRIIGTIGCDIYYPTTGKTHFYGSGTADPLRLGQGVLEDKFQRFLRNAKQLNVEVYNFSGETRGLNPFTQKMFQSIILERRWPKHFPVPKRLHLSKDRPRPMVK